MFFDNEFDVDYIDKGLIRSYKQGRVKGEFGFYPHMVSCFHDAGNCFFCESGFKCPWKFHVCNNSNCYDFDCVKRQAVMRCWVAGQVFVEQKRLNSDCHFYSFTLPRIVRGCEKEVHDLVLKVLRKSSGLNVELDSVVESHGELRKYGDDLTHIHAVVRCDGVLNFDCLNDVLLSVDGSLLKLWDGVDFKIEELCSEGAVVGWYRYCLKNFVFDYFGERAAFYGGWDDDSYWDAVKSFSVGRHKDGLICNRGRLGLARSKYFYGRGSGGYVGVKKRYLLRVYGCEVCGVASKKDCCCGHVRVFAASRVVRVAGYMVGVFKPAVVALWPVFGPVCVYSVSVYVGWNLVWFVVVRCRGPCF